ncbi:hypothetical protein HMPREF0262_01324 [Clostridium sp. ATCC 29733]|nr:hypothetical protein HMPREF0262_01324 [Clostridium sp. ATCC 29733]
MFFSDFGSLIKTLFFRRFSQLQMAGFVPFGGRWALLLCGDTKAPFFYWQKHLGRIWQTKGFICGKK